MLRTLILALACSLVIPFANYGMDISDKSKLSLSAQATISRPADEASFSIGIVNLGASAEEALAENSSLMQSMIDSLHKVGLTEADYKTGRFSIHPTYTPYPKDPPANWKPSINGYEVTNSLFVKTEKLNLVGKLIDAASKAGANHIENIHFGLRNFRTYWSEVIGLATENAINDASIIANAAKIQLGRLLSINLDTMGNVSPRVENIYLAKTSAIPPLEAGEVELTASVSISYEILQSP